MSDGDSDPIEVSDDDAIEFLLQALDDRAAGVARPLSEYLARFPGREKAVTDEYERFAAGGGGTGFPATIGPYRVLGELGRGGQAVVYRATDRRLERNVALKVLATTLPLSGGIERFRREAFVTSRLDHPGICSVYDVGEADGVAYIAMRYVEGRSLASVIDDARRRNAAGITEVDPVALVEEAARALHVAHEAGVIHRDVKPGNIMVDQRGQPVLLDFGLARDTSGAMATLTRTGDFFGTPSYMSPEQIGGDGRDLDRRTDVWSLGATLYECLTLRRPFEGATRERLYEAIRTREPEDLRRFDRSLPRDLCVVLATAIEKDIDRRYQSALAFAEDLARVRRREPIQARSAGWVVKTVRFAQRRPGLAWSLSGTIAALLLGLVVTIVLLREKGTALAQVLRLSDLNATRDLQGRAGDLWPATPERVAGADGMDAWIREAEAVIGHENLHVAALDAVRSRGTRAAPGPGTGHHARRTELATRRAELDAEVRGITSLSEHDGRGAALDRLAAGIAEIDAEVAALDAYRFADPRDQWLHAALVELTFGLRALERTVRDVRARREFALVLDRMTRETRPGAWEACGIAVQRGLVPLGPDPRSGLEEFAVLGTGTLPERDANTRRLRISADSAIVLVLLRGGRVMIGADPPDGARPSGSHIDPFAQNRDGPAHVVALRSFLLSKFEMTQAQWMRATGRHPSQFGPGTRRTDTPDGEVLVGSLLHPVEQVSWDDCDIVMRRLGLCLPTEAQWEYAARAGTGSVWWTGDHKDSLEGAANLKDATCRAKGGPPGKSYEAWTDGFAFHAPVGSFRPNAFGLHDTAGNVWEWCRDWFGPYPAAAASNGESDGLNPATASGRRVWRGGGFMSEAENLRSSRRDEAAPGIRANFVGVRPARHLDP